MKKLIVSVAFVCMAAVSQAAMVQWISSTINGLALPGLDGNGSYTANGDALKGNASAFSWIVTFYAEGTDTVKGTLSGDAFAAASSTISKTQNVATMALSTTYDYEVIITATQTDLASYSDAKWDYSGATLKYTATGTFKTNPSGVSTFAETPGSWTVSGAVAAPEPTSGLLMLLGMAGLALRRRRA